MGCGFGRYRSTTSPSKKRRRKETDARSRRKKHNGMEWVDDGALDNIVTRNANMEFLLCHKYVYSIRKGRM